MPLTAVAVVSTAVEQVMENLPELTAEEEVAAAIRSIIQDLSEMVLAGGGEATMAVEQVMENLPELTAVAAGMKAAMG